MCEQFLLVVIGHCYQLWYAAACRIYDAAVLGAQEYVELVLGYEVARKIYFNGKVGRFGCLFPVFRIVYLLTQVKSSTVVVGQAFAQDVVIEHQASVAFLECVGRVIVVLIIGIVYRLFIQSVERYQLQRYEEHKFHV